MRRGVLWASSQGGHWSQLLKVSENLAVYEDDFFITTHDDREPYIKNSSFFMVADASLRSPIKLCIQSLQVLYLIIKLRPSFVITTGASVGFFSCLFGKLSGVTVIWIDSIANAEKLSLSGRVCRLFADYTLTQWPHIEGGRVLFRGAVL